MPDIEVTGLGTLTVEVEQEKFHQLLLDMELLVHRMICQAVVGMTEEDIEAVAAMPGVWKDEITKEIERQHKQGTHGSPLDRIRAIVPKEPVADPVQDFREAQALWPGNLENGRVVGPQPSSSGTSSLEPEALAPSSAKKS